MFRYFSALSTILILSGCSLDIRVFASKFSDAPSTSSPGLSSGYYFTSTDFSASTTLHYENGNAAVQDIESFNLLSYEIHALGSNLFFIAYDPTTFAATLAKYDGTHITHHFSYGGYNNSRVINGLLYFIGKLDASDPDLTLFAWDGVSATPTPIHTPMDQQAPIFALANGDIAFIAENTQTEPTYFGRPGNIVSVAMPPGYQIAPTRPVVLTNSLVSIAQQGANLHLVKIEAGSPMQTLATFDSSNEQVGTLYSSGGVVYFNVEDTGTSQVRLYKYDGTTLTDLNETSPATRVLTAAHGGAFVVLNRGPGQEVYFYNGTIFTKLTNYNGGGFPSNLTCDRCSTQSYSIMKDASNNYFLANPTSFQSVSSLDACLSGGLSSIFQVASQVYLTSTSCTAQMTGLTTFVEVRSGMGSLKPAYIAP